LTVEKHPFSKAYRLNTAVDYSNVFNNAQRSSDKFFTVLAKKNTLDVARLGLAIAKKSVKKAVQRNRIKRVVRESFRLTEQHCKGYDFVVLSHKRASLATKNDLAVSIQKHWQKLVGYE
jgi:ribonuclease P protein component